MIDAASQAARTAALLVREPERAVVCVTGPDRVTWLNGVVTCDVATASQRQAVFGLLLSKVGKLQTDFYALATPNALLLACAPRTAELVHTELERMLVMEDAELTPPAEALTCAALYGPDSVKLAEVAAEQTGVVVGALDRSGLGGAVLLVPTARASELFDELARRGALLATDAAWQTLRIERRLGLFGVDYGHADNPHEAAVEQSGVAWNKGCYLGQEVVFMQDARGKLKRRLAQLEIDGAVPAAGAPVLTPEGEVVGEITSAAASPTLERAVALARVKSPHFEPGTRLAVGGAAASVRNEPI